MHEISASNAVRYLVETGHLAADEGVEVRELSGGVSNIVLQVQRPTGATLVLKQARARLRVPQAWFCSVERIFREIAVLKRCQRVLDQPTGKFTVPHEWSINTPRLLFEDHENYLFGMSAAPTPHATWKDRLLAGVTNPAIAAASGEMLGRLHAGTWCDAAVAQELDDRQFFNDLRIDPFYREVARVHEDLQPAIGRLIDSVWNTRLCLVHGDFSPKNILVWSDGLMLIDFEVGHFGDPAFDLGFCLTHLVLKSLRAGQNANGYLALIEAFWAPYVQQLASARSSAELQALERRTAQNLAGCLLARVDGKSRVDYLENPEPVRQLARALFTSPPPDWPSTLAMISQHVR